MTRALNVGMIGVGNWGANLLRTLRSIGEVNIRWICDPEERTLQRRSATCPDAQTTACMEDVFSDSAVDAVVIATPAQTHFDCAIAALNADKHVFVEKPLALNTEHCVQLAAAARRRGRKLMVGHLMRHHPVVEYLKRLVDAGDLGDIRYVYTQRVNLGVVRQAENAWWSLAPHDVSVISLLFDAVPSVVSATGQCFLQEGVEDVVFATLSFADGRLAHVHTSWLDPCKIRRITVVGTKRMVAFDDMEATEKLRIYDKGVRVSQSIESYAEAIQVRTGDIVIPKVDLSEPLARECRRFVAAVLHDEPLMSDAGEGTDVVRVLEAGSASIHAGGAPVELAKVSAPRPAELVAALARRVRENSQVSIAREISS